MGAWDYSSHSNDMYAMWKPTGGERAIIRKANSHQARGQEIAGVISEKPIRLRQLNKTATHKALNYLVAVIKDIGHDIKKNPDLRSEYLCMKRQKNDELRQIRSHINQ